MKREQAAAARVWLLLRSLDATGRGWHSLDTVRKALTDKDAPLFLCGWRQLRNLLARGQEVFWQRSVDRIWLRTAAKVAANLGVRRLSGQPVHLPVDVCRLGIGAFRAHLYASFHSSRQQENGRFARPISRATLQRLSDASHQSQRNYERRTGVRRSANYAIGNKYTLEERQTRSWRHGRAVFNFTDHNGALGRPSAKYISWQLPNSYQGPHQTCPKGQQKRINRELAVLFMKGMTGNDKLSRRRFYDNGAEAARQYQKSSRQDLYWTNRGGQRRGCQLWHCLPFQEGQVKRTSSFKDGHVKSFVSRTYSNQEL